MGTRREQLHHGESLQRFAARVLGDAARWHEVAALNGLSPPYVGAMPSRRVAAYGDTLLIPGTPSDRVEPSRTSAPDVFKRDARLTHGRLVSADGDFVLVAGRENLRQALSHRVRTPTGELIFHPTYGCRVHELLGARNNPSNNLLGGKFVERAVRMDPRIADVNGTGVDINGDVMRVECEAVTATGHPVDVTLEES